MNADKKNFIQQLHKDTNYSASRRFTNIIYQLVSYLCPAIFILSLLNLVFSSSEKTAAPCMVFVLVAVIVYALNKLAYEWITLQFDIGDASIHSAYVNHANYVLASKRTKDA